jgi:hypothetical protein
MPIRIRKGIIHLDFRFQGKRWRITTGLAANPHNRRLAERWIAEIEFQISLGTFRLQDHFPHYHHNQPVTKQGTFAEAAVEWLASHKQSWAEWTYRKFEDD